MNPIGDPDCGICNGHATGCDCPCAMEKLTDEERARRELRRADVDRIGSALIAARARDPEAGYLRLALKGRVLRDGSPAYVDIPATPGEDPKVLAERVLAAWGELLARTHMP